MSREDHIIREIRDYLAEKKRVYMSIEISSSATFKWSHLNNPIFCNSAMELKVIENLAVLKEQQSILNRMKFRLESKALQDVQS